MENKFNLPESSFQTEKVTYLNQTGTKAIAKSFMANVFMLMACALSISGLVAYLFATNDQLRSSLFTPTGASPLFYIAAFSPIVFVLVMNFGFNRLSATVMSLLFAALAVFMGMSLSVIFLVYTAASLYTCFFAAAGMFGVMAVMGYTTNKDLTSFGNLMYMGLIGIIIASLVNWFMRSEQLYYIIGVVGVLVFTGITAYKVQMLKQIGEGADMNDPTTLKLSIWGAMSLYITFINLFLALLRVFGRRR